MTNGTPSFGAVPGLVGLALVALFVRWFTVQEAFKKRQYSEMAMLLYCAAGAMGMGFFFLRWLLS